MLKVVLAALHLLALGLGLYAVVSRGLTLRGELSAQALQRVFRDDSFWGVAAILWIGTGLWRLLGSTEKSTTYYLHNHAFYAKMGLLVLILLLEVWPMITLIRWRMASSRGDRPEQFALPGAAHRIATISFVQAVLVAGMVVAATMMARGFGAGA